MPRLIVAAAILALGAGLGAQQRGPTFSATANLVVVPAVVIDRKGASLTGLPLDAFQVFEDGRPVPIEVFIPPVASDAGPAEGRFIVLVLDNLRTPPELGSRVQSIARKFVDRVTNTDALWVITLNRGRVSSTTSLAAARAAIDRFRPGLGDSVHSEADDVNQGLRTIASLSEQLSKVPHRRKVLVFIGAASIFSPHEPSAFSDRGSHLSSRWFEAIAATGRHNVSVYVIDPAGLTGRVDDYSEGFAEETGGHAWVNHGNFDAAVQQVLRESISYYLLGYRAPVNHRAIHTIEVKVNAPGAVVRSRRARG